MRQRLPIESVTGSRPSDQRDTLGNVLGWGVCFFGLFALGHSFLLYRTRNFVWSYVGPPEAGFGLVLVICGWGLAKRYAFGLWLAGGIFVALLILMAVDLLRGAFDDGISGLLVALALTTITGSVFGYFVLIRHEFRVRSRRDSWPRR